MGSPFDSTVELSAIKTSNAKAIAVLSKKLARYPKAVDKTNVRTANRVAKGARTDSLRILAQTINAPQREIRKHFSITSAYIRRQKAVLHAQGMRGMPLSRFKPTPSPIGAKGLVRPPKGLQVKVFRKRPAKVAKGTFWMPTRGGYTVMKRTGKKRFPLKKLYGPTPYTYYRRKATLRRVTRRVNDRMMKEWPRQLRYALKQEGAL